MADNDLKRTEFRGDVSLTFDTIAFLVFSSVLACAALLSGSIPVLIGAMVVAPVFDPLIAVPFGVVNRDWQLAGRGVLNSLLMLGVSLATCFATVWLMFVTNAIPDVTEQGQEMIRERLGLGWHSVIIAIAAGAGGALASASDRKQNLIGVVMALALVPALAAAAIALYSGDPTGWGGIRLALVNVGGIITAGIVILYMRRGTGELEDRARNLKDTD